VFPRYILPGTQGGPGRWGIRQPKAGPWRRSPPVFLFAVIIFKLLEIAAVSPPFGLNLFTVLAASDEPIPTGELYRGIIPFIVFDLITIALLLAFPAITTWLSEHMM
jgi:TRAP-type mannitol/chloroaromatic compound transport system permease large subunit